MPSIDFEVYCSKCGYGLCNSTKVDQRRGGVVMEIEPCPECLKGAKSDGYDEGHADGYDKGLEDKEAV